MHKVPYEEVCGHFSKLLVCGSLFSHTLVQYSPWKHEVYTPDIIP
jgi:hypothetical protein